jgi:hypothetical protein
VSRKPLLFVDVETTSLARPFDARPGEVWEVAAVRRDGEMEDEQIWQLPVSLVASDPESLRISGFYERYRLERVAAWASFITEFTRLAEGTHWIGNVPSFDEERVAALFRRYGWGQEKRLPWHYHLIDIESMIVGALLQRGAEVALPWSSDDLSEAIGVDPSAFERHTALGDVRWVMAQWDALHAGGSWASAPSGS